MNAFISGPTKATAMIRLFGLAKVPMIYFVSPTVLALSEERVEVKIPFKRRNKNHLGSMYFGALMVGADVTGGALLLHYLKGQKLSFAFKNATG